MPKVCVLHPSGTQELINVEQPPDIYGLLPSKARHRHSLCVGDSDQQVLSRVFVLYDSMAFLPHNKDDRPEINMYATRLLLDHQLLEPPRVFGTELEHFFSSLPVGPVVLYRMKQNTTDLEDMEQIIIIRQSTSSADDCKLNTPAAATAELPKRHIPIPARPPYQEMAKTRYSHYGQAFKEFLLLDKPGPLAASLIAHFLKEMPRITCTQLDRLQIAVLGAGIYLLNQELWPKLYLDLSN
jgi:hypothetical protein